MSPGDGSLPNHIHIELPKAQELDRWCDCNHDDGRRSCITSIAVDGTFLYSLLDNDSRFQALVVLEIRGEVPPAPQSSCKSLLPSPWPGLQELTGENDALRHIYDRYRLRIPKLVVRLPLNVSVSDAPTTFRRNVAAFQPDTLTVQLYCTEWFEWHAFEEFLTTLFAVECLLGVRRLYLKIFLPPPPANCKDTSGLDTTDNPSPDVYAGVSGL